MLQGDIGYRLDYSSHSQHELKLRAYGHGHWPDYLTTTTEWVPHNDVVTCKMPQTDLCLCHTYRAAQHGPVSQGEVLDVLNGCT
jgi:hypothetical protein